MPVANKFILYDKHKTRLTVIDQNENCGVFCNYNCKTSSRHFGLRAASYFLYVEIELLKMVQIGLGCLTFFIVM